LGVATATNGKIYAIGGYGGNASLVAVEEYDPGSDTWTTRRSMPTPRSGLAVVGAQDGKVYALGGLSGPSGGNGVVDATVEVYDPVTDTWTTRASMPTARMNLAAVMTGNGKIYTIGGEGSTSNFLAVVEAYDPIANTWSARASMSFPRYALGATATNDGNLYAIGGTYSSAVERYIPATDTWTTRTNLPVARGYLGVATATNGKLYAIGGQGDFGVDGTVSEGTILPIMGSVLKNRLSTLDGVIR
jgi:N-acetylneuraminic acid mutarotase